MNTKTFLTAACVSAALVGTGATVALASTEDGGNRAEVQAFMSAGTGLTDAIKSAEASTGAKAMDASFEMRQDGTAGYEVELVKPDGSQLIAMVDAKDGSILTRAQGADDIDTHEDGEVDDD